MTRYEEATALLLPILRAEPWAEGDVNGHLATPAEIATHFAAMEVERRRPPVAKVVAGLLPEAKAMVRAIGGLTSPERRMETLGPLAGTPRAGASERSLAVALGRGGRIVEGSVSAFGATRLMSAAMPGLHERLPIVMPDDEALAAQLDGMLAGLLPGGRAAPVVARSRIDGDGTSTDFVVEDAEGLVGLRFHLRNAAHRPAARNAESLEHFARSAYHLIDNRMTTTRQMEHAHAIVEREFAGTEAVVGRPFVHSIGLAHPAHGRSVVIHVPVRMLSAGLVATDERIVAASRLGLSSVDGDLMSAAVYAGAQRRRQMLVATRGGVRVDVVGERFLTAAGHDAAAILAAARTKDRLVLEGARGDHLRVQDGDVAVTLRIADGLRWNRGVLETAQLFPDSVMAAMAGRSARMVLDHPALEGTVVASARRLRKGGTGIRMVPIWRIEP